MNNRSLLSAISLGATLAFGVLAPAGCSDSVPPTPRAAIYSQLTNGATHTATQCQIGGGTDWVIVGKISENRGPMDPVIPVDNGGSYEGQGVGVECSVSAAGDTLQVNAQAKLAGAGAVTVTGTFAKAPAPTADMPNPPIPPQENVGAVFFRNDFGQFTTSTCVMTFPRPEMGIAPGRIWGQLDCKDVTNTSQMRVCEANAELRFENCAQ